MRGLRLEDDGGTNGVSTSQPGAGFHLDGEGRRDDEHANDDREHNHRTVCSSAGVV